MELNDSDSDDCCIKSFKKGDDCIVLSSNIRWMFYTSKEPKSKYKIIYNITIAIV